ncbi:MAG: class I SAM-dependent methyltransferase [Patescibacteria group bacterium]
MEYLNPEEIITSRKNIKEKLSKFVGPTIRHKSGIKFFSKYADIFLVQYNHLKEDIKVLDCGVAGGGFAKDLYEAGYKNIYGVDIDDYLSPDNRPLIKEFKTADLSFDKIPWPDSYFKVVTAWCVLPHLENPHNFIRETYRVLEPGGLYIISLVNIISWPNRKYFMIHKEFPSYHASNNHITLFTPAIFKKTILKYFDLVGTEYFITPRIFYGFKGNIRKYVLNFLYFLNNSLGELLYARWGAKIVYILKKKN